jgi:small Trp-rich protein
MLFLILGIIMLGLKYQEIGPVAKLEWWQVLIPFGLAVLWWAWADWSGFTKRKEMDLMEKRKKDRLQKQRESLMGTKKR